MGCGSCFGFLRKPHRSLLSSVARGSHSHYSQEFLLTDDDDDNLEDADGASYNGDGMGTRSGSEGELRQPSRTSEEIILMRVQKGLICREVPVKETRHVTRTEDENGNKMINEYVRNVRSVLEAMVFHKSHLLKLRVAPSETAMSDVLREVSIMKMLDHPNIVNLIEVIDDPNTDNFYMVLEYVEGKWVFEGSGPPGGLGESTSRRYLRDIVAGLMYLHAHHIVHGDIKPDNLLVTSSGLVKIGDFSVSQVFEDDNDELRRSPGTPVFTAPECCLDPKLRITLHGVAEHPWVVSEEGPLPQFLCRCKRKSFGGQENSMSGMNGDLDRSEQSATD
ncbi:Serine/threonine-protein kinase GRIK2 [Acorus calamus]|uniref:Serine/threonine-protein kinase GRIK2 n=1 Tax=Acorus calamus TaxID=4465 RepID=A0AAV9EYQ4_ACOCL|nr:Serine/threonine-protein kinase GRIK2 [Acorus calamus]